MVVVASPPIEREQSDGDNRNDHDRGDDDGLWANMRSSFPRARCQPTLWTSCTLFVRLVLISPIVFPDGVRFGVRRISAIVARGRSFNIRSATHTLPHGEIVRQTGRTFFDREASSIGRGVGKSGVSLLALRTRLSASYNREVWSGVFCRFLAAGSRAVFHEIVSQRLALRRPVNTGFGCDARAFPCRLANLASGGHLRRFRARRIADAPFVHVARLVYAPRRLVVLVVPLRHSPFLLRLSEQPKGTVPFG